MPRDNPRVAAVIAEFNPFHNGHQYLLNQIRDEGFEFIIAIMSGNFVQRGEPAIVNKFVRAKTALSAGFDMVLELPTVYSLASANVFASAAVYILNSTSIVDCIFFGSESGDLSYLEYLKNITETLNFKKELNRELNKGVSYPKAVECSILKIDRAQNISLLDSPNDILALEYIRALSRLNSKIKPWAIKRIGTGHNALSFTSNIASGSFLRSQLKVGINNIMPFVPQNVFAILREAYSKGVMPATIQLGERAIFARLRNLTQEQLKVIAGANEGLENRLIQRLKTATSFEDLLSSVKCKRYTRSRISRLIFNAFLDIKAKEQLKMPEYIRVLGVQHAKEVLINLLYKNSKLPIVFNINKINNLNLSIQNALLHEARNTDAYSLFLPQIGKSGAEYTYKFINV
ncbi:MAG: nucleotidyltransferase family protein [Oscillospiraceae bacterium]